MSETSNLLLVLQPSLALRCGDFQLALLILAYVLYADGLAEVGEDFVLRFVYYGGELVDLLFQGIVVSLSLFNASEFNATRSYTRGERTLRCSGSIRRISRSTCLNSSLMPSKRKVHALRSSLATVSKDSSLLISASMFSSALPRGLDLFSSRSSPSRLSRTRWRPVARQPMHFSRGR